MSARPRKSGGAGDAGDGIPREPTGVGGEQAAPVVGEARRVLLPPSGLATDVLRELGRQPPAAAVSRAGAPAGAADGAGIASKPGGAEDRIFAFADEMGAAAAAEAEERAEQLETWVTFNLLDEQYALPVSHVQEILRVGTITRVPNAPGPVRGITNLRGRVLTVVDLRLRLGLVRTDVDPHSRILVVNARGRLIGMLVDAVSQVVRLARERIEPAPADVLSVESNYILGVYQGDAGLFILLDVEKVLLLRDGS